MVFTHITRFTLFVGARASLLMQCCGREIERTWVLPHGASNLDDVLKEACWRKPHFPIKIVLDTASVDVRQDDMPTSAAWARGRILQRQCAAHFPESFISGSAEYVQEAGRRKALHAGATSDALLMRVAARMDKLANPVEALSFFPVEAPSCAAQVALMPQKGWAVMHVLLESSGLRQIVLHDGMPVFTRLHGDTVPSLPTGVLATQLALHVASTRDYLPRLAQGDVGQVAQRLFVPVLHKDIGAEGALAGLGLQVYALDAPRGEIVPPEWAADVAWLFLAARQRHAVLPLAPSWLKQRNDSQWKRRIALWVLLFFGSAGVFSGVSILTKTVGAHDMSAPPALVAPAPLQTSQAAPPPKPPEMALDAVIYNSPQDWAVWINGQKHTPESEAGDIRVVGVSASEVQVRWQQGGHSEEFTLAMKNAAQGLVTY